MLDGHGHTCSSEAGFHVPASLHRPIGARLLRAVALFQTTYDSLHDHITKVKSAVAPPPSPLAPGGLGAQPCQRLPVRHSQCERQAALTPFLNPTVMLWRGRRREPSVCRNIGAGAGTRQSVRQACMPSSLFHSNQARWVPCSPEALLRHIDPTFGQQYDNACTARLLGVDWQKLTHTSTIRLSSAALHAVHAPFQDLPKVGRRVGCASEAFAASAAESAQARMPVKPKQSL